MNIDDNQIYFYLFNLFNLANCKGTNTHLRRARKIYIKNKVIRKWPAESNPHEKMETFNFI